jgi:hypothetical protein
MEENERWSIHLEYLKLAIALATALIAAAAAIYVDGTKIPVDDSRFILLGAIALFALMLVSSVVSIGKLGNHLIHFGRAAAGATAAPATTTTATPVTTATATATPAPDNRRAKSAIRAANVSFGCLLIGAFLLVAFFAVRTLSIPLNSFDRALQTATRGASTLVNKAKGEGLSLKSIDGQSAKWVLDFSITPSGQIITVETDATGGKILTARRQ